MHTVAILIHVHLTDLPLRVHCTVRTNEMLRPYCDVQCRSPTYAGELVTSNKTKRAFHSIYWNKHAGISENKKYLEKQTKNWVKPVRKHSLKLFTENESMWVSSYKHTYLHHFVQHTPGSMSSYKHTLLYTILYNTPQEASLVTNTHDYTTHPWKKKSSFHWDYHHVPNSRLRCWRTFHFAKSTTTRTHHASSFWWDGRWRRQIWRKHTKDV